MKQHIWLQKDCAYVMNHSKKEFWKIMTKFKDDRHGEKLTFGIKKVLYYSCILPPFITLLCLVGKFCRWEWEYLMLQLFRFICYVTPRKNLKYALKVIHILSFLPFMARAAVWQVFVVLKKFLWDAKNKSTRTGEEILFGITYKLFRIM